MAGVYSQDNIAAMQEDALKRVREMQKKAKQKVSQNQMFNIYDNFQEKNPKNDNVNNSFRENNISEYGINNFSNKIKKEKNINVKNEKNMFSSLIKNILPDMESDRIFLLFLILMLQGQECDNGLLLALFYIIMWLS